MDELGNPIESEYGVGIYLMEDVESGRVIAKFDGRTPDKDGIVWI
ncbi:MAG TPA: hypothetical protein VG815_09215 [Chloroflexota bacterium]|nr:hypothetical protein [Chloroflexota bacterium]